MNEWLTTKELAQLEGVHHVTIAARIRTGRYKAARKVRSHGGGTKGTMHLINIYDPAVEEEVRNRFFLKHFIRKTLEGILRSEIKNIWKRFHRRNIGEMKVKDFLKCLHKEIPL